MAAVAVSAKIVHGEDAGDSPMFATAAPIAAELAHKKRVDPLSPQR